MYQCQKHGTLVSAVGIKWIRRFVTACAQFLVSAVNSLYYNIVVDPTNPVVTRGPASLILSLIIHAAQKKQDILEIMKYKQSSSNISTVLVVMYVSWTNNYNDIFTGNNRL